MAEERFTWRTVTVVMAVIAALAFVFSVGNVWALALRLGVPRPIAPLIAPMVGPSVVGLLIALRFLALRGGPKAELRAGTQLLHLCGLLTLALNTAEPLLTGRYGRACLDTVAPLLLLGWGHVGPAFLAQFHTPIVPAPNPEEIAAPLSEPVPDEASAPESAPTVPVPVTAVSPVEEPKPIPAPTAISKTAHSDSGPAHRGHPPCRARSANRSGPVGDSHGHRPAGGHRRTRSALSPGLHRPHPPRSTPRPPAGPGSSCPEQHQHALPTDRLLLWATHPTEGTRLK
ncbi:SpdA protein [Streptomyces buecherae]|uniref:SpdA protein n=1 Tax=Streptomyces buecherae TaxID=2763006 RepID=UPI0020B6F116|nr:SpdA protein [Streptomyces buecherae]